MRLVEAAKPTFARHETFHPRYGWFRKAYAVTKRDSQIFTHIDAPVLIGVGKNMVRSIRFWGLAAKLITARIGKGRDWSRRSSGTRCSANRAGIHTWRIQVRSGCCTGSYWHRHRSCLCGGLHSMSSIRLSSLTKRLTTPLPWGWNR